MIESAPQAEARDKGYSFGDFSLDVDRAALLRGGEPVRLRPQSFEVLLYLVQRHGRLVHKNEILEAVWGRKAVTADSLTQCLIDVRRAIGDGSREMIRTVPRRGYVFDLPVRRLTDASGRSARAWTRRSAAAWLIVLAAMIPLVADRPETPQPQGRVQEKSVNVPAVDRYRQGRFLLHRRVPGDLAAAAEHFRAAIELEPGYAEAWAGLAGVYVMLVDGGGVRQEIGAADLKHAAEKAVELGPELSEGWLRLSNYYERIGDLPSAWRYLQKGLALAPDDSLSLAFGAGLAARQGDIENAIALQQRAVYLEPLSFVYRSNLSVFLLAAGRLDEALGQSRAATRIRPGPQPELVQGFSYVQMEQYAHARDLAAGWPQGPNRHAVLAMAYFSLGLLQDAERAMQALMSDSSTEGFLRLAELEAFCRNVDRALAALTRLRDRYSGDSSKRELRELLMEVRVSPFLASMEGSAWEQWLAETEEMLSEGSMSTPAAIATREKRPKAADTRGPVSTAS